MQNTQVERANRTIGEAIKSMLLASDMHSRFWGETAATYTYVHNLLPRKQLNGRSAWSVFTGKSDPLAPQFYFGEKVLFWTQPEKAAKLLPRGHTGLFLGPAFAAVQYPGCHRVWNLETERLIIVSDVRSLQKRSELTTALTSAIGTFQSVREGTAAAGTPESLERNSLHRVCTIPVDMSSRDKDGDDGTGTGPVEVYNPDHRGPSHVGGAESSASAEERRAAEQDIYLARQRIR